MLKLIRRWPVVRPRFQVETRRNYASVLDKYRAKLAAKAERQGLSLEELLLQAQPQVEDQKRADVADLVKQAAAFRTKTTPNSSNPGSGSDPALSNVKAQPTLLELNSFVDVDKFRAHNGPEIEMLWKARFVNSTYGFSGSMNAEAFSKLYVNARKFPTFVLPLPHPAHGIELHYVQWSLVASQTIYCLITSLAQYKLHNEYAQPHTTFMLHTDLAADKGVVLTNAMIQDNQISLENAALLTLNLQRFYTANDQNEHGRSKLELLQKFNQGDRTFSTDALIEATETLD